MPIVALREITQRAFEQRYGVVAINVFNDLTMEAVLAAASAEKAPLIVQTSVKTVVSIGPDQLMAMWKSAAENIDVPVTLHLDHCPDREVLTRCLEAGWNSALFDGSSMDPADNLRHTTEVVEQARAFDADVEGELEAITGVEDGIGSDLESRRETLEAQLDFVRKTGIAVFAPAIGNAHGRYASAPALDAQRVSDIVAENPIPIALHGSSGLAPEQIRDLVERGCAKVNVSTALKERFMKSSLRLLEDAQARDSWDPPTLFHGVRADVIDMVREYIRICGSAGKAW